MQFRSKVDELIDRLRSEGKVTTMPEAEVQAIREHIDNNMREFRLELRRKEAQSIEDTRKIVLNAMTTVAETIRHAITQRGLSLPDAAAKLEISAEYLECILAKRLRITAFVAVRLEGQFSELSAQKMLLDQAFVELYRARTQYEASSEQAAA